MGDINFSGSKNIDESFKTIFLLTGKLLTALMLTISGK